VDGGGLEEVGNMPNIQYLDGDDALLEAIEPLWQKLNDHHQAKSVYFSDLFKKFTFAEKLAEFDVEDKPAIRVDLARDVDTGKLVGYCVSTIHKHQVGEIDSMFVEKDYRGQGIADCLIRKGLDWIKTHSVKSLRISVAYGNEEVFDFYKRYGFLPRNTILIPKVQD
jgi:ribosomal protein S18 acetylase RimI-like enzyme